jgi:hypothetical protein
MMHACAKLPALLFAEGSSERENPSPAVSVAGTIELPCTIEQYAWCIGCRLSCTATDDGCPNSKQQLLKILLLLLVAMVQLQLLPPSEGAPATRWADQAAVIQCLDYAIGGF